MGAMDAPPAWLLGMPHTHDTYVATPPSPLLPRFRHDHAAAPSGRDTQHWEGGADCRDKARMDRRDRKKYRGSKHKTQSAKDKRVGQRGAERRDHIAGRRAGAEHPRASA